MCCLKPLIPSGFSISKLVRKAPLTEIAWTDLRSQYKHTKASMLVLPKEMHDSLRYNVHVIHVLNSTVIWLPFNCSFNFETREEAHSVPYLHIGCREDP